MTDPNEALSRLRSLRENSGGGGHRIVQIETAFAALREEADRRTREGQAQHEKQMNELRASMAALSEEARATIEEQISTAREEMEAQVKLVNELVTEVAAATADVIEAEQSAYSSTPQQLPAPPLQIAPPDEGHPPDLTDDIMLIQQDMIRAKQAIDTLWERVFLDSDPEPESTTPEDGARVRVEGDGMHMFSGKALKAILSRVAALELYIQRHPSADLALFRSCVADGAAHIDKEMDT